MTPYVHPGIGPECDLRFRKNSRTPRALLRAAPLGVAMFSRLKIASKLLIGFGAVLLLLAGISGLATFSGMRSKDALQDVTRLTGDEVLEQRVEKRLFEARMHFWMAIDSKDPLHWTKSGEG